MNLCGLKQIYQAFGDLLYTSIHFHEDSMNLYPQEKEEYTGFTWPRLI